MNRAYKLVWNTVSKSWVVASELAKGAKKASGKTLKLAVFMAAGFSAGVVLAAPAINALPTGESVAAGSATFDRSVSNQLTVNQTSNKLISNWNNFDVGVDARVLFVQPTASSIALNRVTGGSPTEIIGQIGANGQVVLVNPNGISFGVGSQVSAASIIGSVLDISDSDFNSGNLLFSRGAATGSIINKGTLSASKGGVALLAPSVSNSGIIIASGANASLISADAVNLSAVDAAITTASSISGLIQNSGSIQATQLSAVGGKIVLRGDTSQASSQIQLAGTLEGTETQVAGRSILVNGDIDVNGSANSLQLTSTNGYNLTNAAAVNLNGAGSAFSVNGAAYTVIRNITQLQAMNTNLTGRYVLANNIDASATSGWNSGAGFAPVGNLSINFSGQLDGLGHSVNALSISRSGSGQGLFGVTNGATIQNIGLSNVNMAFTWSAGPLVGFAVGGQTKISNVYTSGNLTFTAGSTGFLGGLIGATTSSGSINLSNSYSTVNITGTTATNGYIGGLMGGANSGNNVFSNVYYAGNISTQTNNVGGVFGGALSGGMTLTLNNVYASGAVSGATSVGALVGAAGTLTINNSYWNSSKTGLAVAVGNGGGTLNNVSGITNAQSTQLSSFANWGSTIDAQGVTGSVWRIYEGQTEPLLRGLLKSLTITAGGEKTYDATAYSGRSFSLNSVDTSKIVNYGNLTFGGTALGATNAGFYNTATIGNGAQLYSGQQGYDIKVNGSGSLTINKAGLLLSSSNVSKTYDGTTAASGTVQIKVGQLFGASSLNGGSYAFADKHAGSSKKVMVSNVTVNDGNNGNNYNVFYDANTNSTINKANLTLSTSNVTKTYDGTTNAAGTAIISSGALFDTDSISGGTFAFSNKNAGTGKTVTTSAVTVADGNGGNNYNVTYANNSNSTINKAALVLTTTDVTKTYDGTTAAAGTAVATSGTQVFAGDSLSGGTFAFDSKHAGTGKTVTSSGVTVNDGNSGGNYDVSFADNSSSTINKASLVLTTTDVSKTYDGTTDAAGTAIATNSTQVFAGDSISGGTFVFDNRNAGNGKTVATSGVTVDDGNSGNNYTVTYANNSNSTINKANLVLTTTDVSKTYDGTVNVVGSAVVDNGQLFGGDSIAGGIFLFNNKNTGTGKTVTTSNVTVNDGNSGNNYSVTYANNTNSTINKANLVLTTTDVSKTYDGTTTAAGMAIVSSGALFDTDAISGGTFAFSNKNAGTGKTVTTSAVTVDDGNSGNNYNVTFVDNTNSTINKAALVLTTTDVSKTYDGTSTAAGTAVTTSGTEVFAGDSISGGTFAFSNKNAGTGKTVTTSAVTVDDGNSGNNYNVTFVDNTNSTINKAALVLTSTDVAKTYDGTNAAVGTVLATSGTQVFAGDSLSGGTIAFADKNAGTGKHVVVSGVTVNDGNNGGNYDVTYVDNTTSTINKRLLTISAVADSKVFDGKLNSVGKPVVVGRQRGDSIAGLTQSFANKNAGTGKTINVDASYVIRDGNNGNNYDVVLVNSTAGVITPKALTISTVANSKVYDGGVTSANKPVVTGLLSGDRVTGLFQQYETKTVGTGKKLLIKSGYVVNDSNGGNNYTVTEQGSTDGVITVN